MYSSCTFQFFDLLKCFLLSGAFDLLSTDFPGKILLEGKRAPQNLRLYLLIAGTYTPFTLVNLQGTWGWILFSTIWCLAVIGILVQVLYS